MSLYRKYRPQRFEHLVGQDHVRITLSNALKLDRVNHAYLFTGPRGTGKTSTARLMAKAINCLNLKEAEPCEECEICRDISEGRLIDVIEIDAASNRGIDEMRDLREKINFAPTRAKRKVYIIDEVHMLTKEAFNALLKTLEEPPAHVYFILATTEVHKIPETILSRCQRFDFKRIEDDVMVARLAYIAKEEKFEADEKALRLIAHHAQGGLRDAIGLLEQLTVENKITVEHASTVLGVSGFLSMEKLYACLLENDVKNGLAEIHALYTEGIDLNYFTKSFLEYLRKKILESVSQNKPDQTARLLGFIRLFQDAYEQSRFATIVQLPLEMAVIQAGLQQGDSERAIPNAVPGHAEKKIPVTNTPPIVTPQVATATPQVSTMASSIPTSMQTERAHKSIASSDAPTIALDMQEIQKQWPRILEHLKTPLIKRTFQESKLDRIEGQTVILAFASKFHVEKLMEVAYRTEVEAAFDAIFKVPVKIIGEVKTLSAEMQQAEAQLTNSALEIFEGELA